MSSDDYQVQDTYRYSRKSYKKSCRDTHGTEADSPRIDTNQVSEISPRNGDRNLDEVFVNTAAGCNCEIDPDGEIAYILHKKRPVITLAQQQLQRLLDENDNLLCDHTKFCRSVYDFFFVCKDIFSKQKLCCCALLTLNFVVFVTGLIIGAASCGSYLGRFNSPILTCIDNLFIPDSYSTVKDTYLSLT